MSKFTESVDTYLEGIECVSAGACPGCEECELGNVDSMESPEWDQANEGSFSWSQCETCGSRLGGDRFPSHGFSEDGEIVHLDVCVDCLIYLANGDEPEEWEG